MLTARFLLVLVVCVSAFDAADISEQDAHAQAAATIQSIIEQLQALLKQLQSASSATCVGVKCDKGYHCQVVQAVCIRAPCNAPSTATCVPNKADDITSPSLRLRIIEQDRLTVAAFLVYFVVALVVVAFRVHYFLSLAMLLVAVVCLIYIVMRVRPGVEQTRERLSWIFARFASIESLHLHNVNRETLDVVRKLLGTVPIKNLIVYERTVDPGLRSRIVSMARVHKVDQITVCAMTFLETGLRQFCMAATEAAKRMEIYESSGGSLMIFGYERQFWERKAKEMSDGSFSIRVMNGQQLESGDDTHKLRFRINA